MAYVAVHGISYDDAVKDCYSGLALEACARCGASGCAWDRVGGSGGDGTPLCPDCSEAIARGGQFPLTFRRDVSDPSRRCACCLASVPGWLRLRSFPRGCLAGSSPVSVGLCPGHFHAVVGRFLDVGEVLTLARRLHWLGFSMRRFYLLSECFYDGAGVALRPIIHGDG